MNADGFLVIDKPPGLTSHDVVAILRAVTGLNKVGHTGTLDPFATGVLPLALGGATRLIQFLDEREKIYDATVTLGSATDTGDPTGTVIESKPVPPLDKAHVLEVLAGFVGDRMQTPPRYSAVKVKGKPLYAYARKGQDVAVQARPITVHGMELVELEETRLRVIIKCSRGTYARVLAEEIGEALGTLGHLGALRRLGSGPFLIEQALSFGKLAEAVAGDPDWGRVLRPGRDGERVQWRTRDQVFASLNPAWVSPRVALGHLPRLELTPADARRFARTGIQVPAPPNQVLLTCGEDVLGVAGPTGGVALSRETIRAGGRSA